MLIPCHYSREQLPALLDYLFELLYSADVLLVDVKENHAWSQPWYFPRVPDTTRQALYKFYYYDGGGLDVDGIYAAWKKKQPVKPEPAPFKPKETFNTESGQRDPIAEFNQANSCAMVLTDCGYEAVGNRYLHPDSQSGIPGTVILTIKDGVERVYSHSGNDILNDGFAHDAFDCYRLLECGKDWTKALGWSEEITRHNQRFYMQDKADKETLDGLENLDEPKANQESDDPKAKAFFPFISAAVLVERRLNVNWLIKSFLLQGSLNLLFGDPSSGKSLMALDWAFCIAVGLPWNGFAIKQMDVVVIAGEGFAGIPGRLKALEIKYNVKAPVNLYVSEHQAQLMDKTNAKWVADSIKAICPNPGLVVIDTLHRNIEGNENASEDMGVFIQNVDSYLRRSGATVLIVHHSGHGDKNRSRGSSSIRASMDGEFSTVKDDEGSITLACSKAKDFEEPKPIQFSLAITDLGQDDDGESMASIYLEYQGTAVHTTKKKKLSVRDASILRCLSEAIAEHGVAPTEEMRDRFPEMDFLSRVVHIDFWRKTAYQVITVVADDDLKKSKARKQIFSRSRNKLLNAGFTSEYGDYVWVI